MNAIRPGMSIREIALAVSTVLLEAGIDLVLTGGAVVSIYTENRYQSYDLDFVSHADQKKNCGSTVKDWISFPWKAFCPF